MKISIKKLSLVLGTAAVGAAAFSTVAVASDFPTRPITITVPFTAGGATDVLTRTVAEGLSKELGQTVVVANVPGAGGSIGQSKVARERPDGYNLLLGNVGTLAANASLYENLPYNILTDFTPIASVGDAPQVLTVHAGFPADTFEEFVERARNNGDEMNFGTAGVGSGSFLGGVVLNAAIGAKIEPVHYRGAAQATSDVMAGHIDYTIESSSTAVSTAASGKAKIMLVMRESRVDVLPNVTAAGETAFPDMKYDIWNMILAPKGVPEPVLQKLNDAINRTLQQPEVKERYAKMGISVPTESHRSLEGSKELLSLEVENWRKLLQEAGVKAQASS